MAKIGVIILALALFLACASAIHVHYEFPYYQLFNGSLGAVRIGAEGMAVLNGPGMPRLFVLSHSQKYQRGYIHELNFTENYAPGTGAIISSIPLDNTTLTNIGEDFTGITFNLEGNLAVLGKRLNDVGVVEGVVFTLTTGGARVGGPISLLAPLITPTDIAFDPTYKSYWVVDRDSNAMYEEVLTCCEEKNYGTYKRWEQQLRMKRVFGLEYGLKGFDNIFVKREAEEEKKEVVADKAPVEAEEKAQEKRDVNNMNGDSYTNQYHYSQDLLKTGKDETVSNVLHFISSPAFADPEGIDVDPVTGHLWVLNDAPTTVLYEVTRDGIVLNAYQLEQLTGYQDANSVAATEDFIIVGFDDERTIVVFDKTDDDDTLPYATYYNGFANTNNDDNDDGLGKL